MSICEAQIDRWSLDQAVDYEAIANDAGSNVNEHRASRSPMPIVRRALGYQTEGWRSNKKGIPDRKWRRGELHKGYSSRGFVRDEVLQVDEARIEKD